MHQHVFHERAISGQQIAGSTFYEGVKYDEGLLSYYLRNIWKVGAGLLLAAGIYGLYYSRDWRDKSAQDMMDMAIYHALCDGQNPEQFYINIIRRNI